MRPDLAAVIADGLPAQTPMFAQALQARQPVFTDAWDAAREVVVLGEEYRAAAKLQVQGQVFQRSGPPVLGKAGRVAQGTRRMPGGLKRQRQQGGQ